MNKWMLVRLGLAGWAVAQGLTLPNAPFQEQWAVFATPSMVIGVFVFGLFATVVLAATNRSKSGNTVKWRYPSWSISPFIIDEPLQFFHMAGFFMLIAGISYTIALQLDHRPLGLAGALLVAFGLGILGGTYLSTRMFREKMQQDV